MVGITHNRWLATGMSTLLAAGMVVGASAAVLAQDDECPAAVVTGELPDLTEQLGHKPKVGLVMKSLANAFFQQMDAGAKAFAADNEDLFEFQTVGMADERDFNAQVEAIENYITQEFDVIVIAPADSQGMPEHIAKAIEAGITVVNIDVALDAQAMADAGIDLAFFGPDNRLEEANELMTNFLTQYPDLQGAMAANDSMALGVIAALEAVDKVGEVEVIGFDNIPGVRPYIADGSMLATIEQYGAQMAVFGIEMGLRELAGESFCGWQLTPIDLVTAENVVVE